MVPDLVNILAILTALALIILMIVIYIRSRQGDHRVIDLSNRALIPILCAIILTLNIIFANRPATPLCSGPLAIIGYGGLIVFIFLVGIGVLRFFRTGRRDVRLVMHPILLSVIIMTITFLLEYLSGCL